MERRISLFIGVSIGIIITLIILFIKGLIKEYRIKKRFKRGLEGEKKAAKLLRQYGYKVMEYQGDITYDAFMDDELYKINIRPDYIVEKNGKYFIAEVKTGDFATSITQRDTRRQLLEYYAATGYGILLVDMEKDEIFEVSFAVFKKNKEFDYRMPFFFTVISFIIYIILTWK